MQLMEIRYTYNKYITEHFAWTYAHISYIKYFFFWNVTAAYFTAKQFQEWRSVGTRIQFKTKLYSSLVYDSFIGL